MGIILHEVMNLLLLCYASRHEASDPSRHPGASPPCRVQIVTGASPTSSPNPSPQRAALPTGTGFDYYLLNLSWSPEFCYSHPDAAECASHPTFILHGLWPQNTNGTYPENCSNAPGPADPAAFKDIYADSGLLEHEWRTHGTCSGLNADVFFATARTAVHSIVIPRQLATLTTPTSISPTEVMDLFMEDNPKVPRESLAVSCGNNYLTAVEVCLNKTLHPIQCGPGIRSCRAVIIRIPATPLSEDLPFANCDKLSRTPMKLHYRVAFLHASLLAILVSFGLTLSAQREPVLKQVDLPHRYYYREMYLPQLTTGPNAAAWTPDSRSLVYSMAGTLWRQAVGSDAAGTTHLRSGIRLSARLLP